jgi:hypothetical protein
VAALKRNRFGLALVFLAAITFLSGCGGTVDDEYVIEEQPYTLEPVEGDEELFRVILLESAVERLGIETAPVEASGSKLVVPYDAVYLDAHGDFWVYTNPEPLAFVRAPIEISRETSSHAVLSEGPPAGTEVVTVGVPELYGTETEFGT